MNFLVKREYALCLETAMNVKMNYLQCPNSLIQNLSSTDGIIFTEKYLTQIRPSVRISIMSKLEPQDYFAMMKMPNIVSGTFFKLCIKEDCGLTFPDKILGRITWFP